MKCEKYTYIAEYPIKTINVSERVDNIQVDTGPVIFVKNIDADEFVPDNVELAHIAYFERDKTSFVFEKQRDNVYDFIEPLVIEKNIINELYCA